MGAASAVRACTVYGRTYNPAMTLYQFFGKYAPDSDQDRQDWQNQNSMPNSLRIESEYAKHAVKKLV
jgi:hypothetical protein